MIGLWWTLVAVAALAVVLRFLNTGGLAGALKQVRRTGEVAAVVAAVEGAPKKKHPNMWDQAIGALWREYRRPEAMKLMVAAARRTEAPVVQFWLRNALEVEPELAQEYFSEGFLKEYFRPAVAASCGRVGCCG